MKIAHLILSKTLVVFFILFSLASCHTSIDFGRTDGDGNVVTQKRTLTEKFDKIEVNTGIEVVVSQNDIASVEVEIDENIQSMITTTVENGVLIVSSSEPYNTNSSPTVRVKMPYIAGLKSSSGATIKSGTTLKTTSIIVDSSSGSEISIEVEADYISMESTSGSSIDVIGKALKAETSSSSGSDIDAGKLMANEVFSQVSSGSTTYVYPIISLKGKASSGGDIRYKNIPQNLDKDESSGGSIKKD